LYYRAGLFPPIGNEEVSMFSFRRLWIGVSLAFLGAFPLRGAAISVIVAETGLRDDVPASESSGLWESGLLEGLFDQGHIVSNAPIARLKGNPGKDFPEELRRDLDEALEGGMEFIIVALLDYEGDAGSGASRPQRISVRLFRLRPLQCIAEQRLQAGDIKKPEEVFSMAKNAAGMILSRLTDRSGR
jgi:hypothetical protein